MEKSLINNEKSPARAELVAVLGEEMASGDIGVKPEQAAAASRFFADLEAGQFGEVLKSTEETFPTACIDGRTGEDLPETSLKTAGGTLSFWAAYRLTGGTMDYDGFLQILQENDLPIGGHTDDHDHTSGGTGCGANDKLPEIIEKLANPQTNNPIFNTAGLIDNSTDAFSQVVIENSAKDLAAADLGSAAQRTENLAKFVKPDRLTGQHQEVTVLVNLRENTAVDTSEISKKYGAEISAFAVDAWTFQNSAEKVITAINMSGQDPEYLNIASSYRLADALTAFNLATASALCAPGMKIITIK
ncbi:MAG: cadmium-containing carbonic anhydrase [Candidatus Nomurabacteria bacterium]|nr:cadmium-containing carbonic anhydrase [Candidatus Nomurabacteria bacterium]